VRGSFGVCADLVAVFGDDRDAVDFREQLLAELVDLCWCCFASSEQSEVDAKLDASIVGCRRASDYGMAMARSLARGLAVRRLRRDLSARWPAGRRPAA